MKMKLLKQASSVVFSGTSKRLVWLWGLTCGLCLSGLWNSTKLDFLECGGRIDDNVGFGIPDLPLHQTKNSDLPLQRNKKTPKQNQQELFDGPALQQEILDQDATLLEPFSLVENVPEMHEIPIVIISALRPGYLEQVMKSLEIQNPHTPDWIGKSPRYLFIHTHAKNNIGNAYKDVIELAQKYHWKVHEFHRLYNPNAPMNVNANYQWYKMMDYLFLTHLHAKEALIVEDDTILAPDALLVAARMFLEKRKNAQTIHAITLGGWSGEHRINPHPDTYLALKQPHFQPMAYGLNATLFERIFANKKDNIMKEQPHPDWAEEIVSRRLIEGLVMLSPSLSRMKHIGAYGMGPKGEAVNLAGGPTRVIAEGHPWDAWMPTISDFKRTLQEYILEPHQVTDEFGFLCYPQRIRCDNPKQSLLHNNTTITRLVQSKHAIPPNAQLGPRIKIIKAKATSSYNEHLGPQFAIDNDFFTTRWASVETRKKPFHQSITLDFGKPFDLSSVTILWEIAYADHYQVQIKPLSPENGEDEWTTIHNVTDGQGFTEHWDLTGHKASRYLRILCTHTTSKWGYSIWEIVVRGK